MNLPEHPEIVYSLHSGKHSKSLIDETSNLHDLEHFTKIVIDFNFNFMQTSCFTVYRVAMLVACDNFYFKKLYKNDDESYILYL